MALLLQFTTIIVPRKNFERCRSLPGILNSLNKDGGILFETSWYDRHLWCETAMNNSDANDILRQWNDRGLTSIISPGENRFIDDICVADSRRGPVSNCEWLEYDAKENCVWLKGTDKGEIIGGHEQVRERQERLQTLLARGEHAYDEMYDSRRPKDEYEAADLALSQALALARFLHQPADADRIEERVNHIRAVYESQFRGW